MKMEYTSCRSLRSYLRINTYKQEERMYSNIVKNQSYKCLRVSVLQVQIFEGEETYKCLSVFSDI